MADDITAEGTADTAQGAEGTEGSPPPWGEDFNPERAWKTITHLRGRENELEKQAKQFERLSSGEGEDLFRELGSQYGYEFEEADEDDGEDYEDFDDPYEGRMSQYERDIAELKDQLSRQEVDRTVAAFEDQVDKLSTNAEVELSDRERLLIGQTAVNGPGGLTKESVEKAFKEHVEWLEGLSQNAVKKYAKTKRAPHVSPVGKEATNAPNLDNERERIAYMAERLNEATE